MFSFITSFITNVLCRPIRFKEVRGDTTEGQVEQQMVMAAAMEIVLVECAQVDEDKAPFMERASQA